MLHEFTVTMPLAEVDEAMEKLNLYGYYNLYYDQPIEQFAEENGYGYIEVKDTAVDLKIILEENETEAIDIQKEREGIASILNIEKEDLVYQFMETEDWQQPFPIIDLQNGWFIKPTYAEEEWKAERKIIHFEPPRAFGSGLHQTTQDCLRLILNENLHEKKVLDLGTGAGLLSIAAALSGAEQITAVDMEDVEAEVLYNARLNQVENRITAIQADVLSPNFQLDGVFDWIFVNIAANEVKQLHPFIDSHLAANGKVILSGMTEWNSEEVLALYEKNGYAVEQLLHSDEWLTALLAKK